MALTFGNKVENNGATSAGKLSAEEFNELVRQVNENESSISDLDESVVKKLKLNGTTYTPNTEGLVEAVINVGTTMNVSRKKANIVAKLGSKIFIEYSFMSVSSLGSTGKGEATYYYNSESNQPLAVVEIDQSEAVDDYSVKFDITDYVTGVGSYAFIVVVKDSQGNQSTARFTIEAIEFSVKNLLPQSRTFAIGESIPYRFGITGSGSASKTVYFYLTNRLTGQKVLAGTSTVVGSDTANLGYTIVPSSVAIDWSHGAYKLSVYATIADGSDVITSNQVDIDLIIVQAENMTPIVSLLNNWEAGFNGYARVYEMISTVVVAYYPNADSVNIKLSANDVEISTVMVDNLAPYHWNYTIEDESSNLVLSAQCGTAISNLPTLIVNGKLVDVEETSVGLALKLSSRGRSNDDANRNVWRSENELYGDYDALLNGFNWSSNGWVDAIDGARALHITNGARVNIPFKLFGSDANTIIQESGRTIEIEFMATNATNYQDTNRIISCYFGGVGFYITPRQVYFQNSSGAASSLSTHFKEGERVRVGLVFQSLIEGGGMFLYLNGKQSGYYTYEPTHSFRQSTPSDIVIDSTMCDVDLYRVMIYNSALTKTQMVNNFTAGKDSVNDMISVYNRNNIFYNGLLSVTLLQDQLPVMIMTAPGLRAWTTQANVDKKMSIKVDVQYIDKSDPRKSFTAKNVVVKFQGTSSMGYPVRNFKISLKGCPMTGDSSFVNISNSKYRLRENSYAVNTFCLKADFAESSSSHNTGAARLIHSVLTTAMSGSSKPYITPPQAACTSGNDVRTTIDGFPIVLFTKETETGEATFAGKYNFNNDKSTQEVFGFEGITGFNDTMTNRTKIVSSADDFRTSTGDINSKSIINPCECWEFKTNDVDLCKFKYNNDSDLTSGALKEAFESRYPEEYAAPSATEEAVMYEDSLWGHHELKKVLMWVHSTDTTQATGAKLPSSKLYGRVTYLYDTVDYRLAKFKAEISEHFNLHNLLSYFLLTDFLGAVDQRAKNQMMASWGNEGAGDFKWYFIFYDNDTILGINNTGKIAHDYDLVSDSVGGYSGRESVLWLNLESCFYDELCSCWGNLNSAVSNNVSILSYNNLIDEFNTRQCEKWAESVFNEDSNYKYVFQGGAINKDSDYYTVMQGSRAEHRKYWLDNRLQWINGKYKSKSFLAEGTGWRCNKVDGVNSNQSIRLNISCARKQYYGYIIGNTTNEVFLLNEGDSRPCEYSGGWDYTNLNLAGEEYMTDFGDISHQLPSDVKIARMTRLKNLKLSSQEFKNSSLRNLSLINKPFLEMLDISYANNLSAITDYAGCYRLKRLLAYQSGLRETPFADGSEVEYAELPKKRIDTNSIEITPGLSSMTLKNMPYITFDNIKMEDDDYSSITSLYIDNCPGVSPLRLFEKICNNAGVSRVVLLNIDEQVKYADTIFKNLVQLSNNTTIPSAENRVTGKISTDSIANLHLGILEKKYSGLSIQYSNIISLTSIAITSNNILKIYEGQRLQLNSAINGDATYTDVSWSIVSGAKYATIDSNGLLSATQQDTNVSYQEIVVVRATLKASKYVYTDYNITVEGVKATGGTITGDTWLNSYDASVMPSISNNAVILTPKLCSKKITHVTWHKNPSDPNYGLYEINQATGAVQFSAVKTTPGAPTMKNNEFTIQIYAEFTVLNESFRADKTIYVDYPNVGDFVYSTGAHSSIYYRRVVDDGDFAFIGVCYYINDDRTDRRMVATKNATATSGLSTCMWGVYGTDLSLVNKASPYIKPDGVIGGWGTEWMTEYPNGIDLSKQQKPAIAIGDMDGKSNTNVLISEREYNGFPNLNSVDDITNQQPEYPAAAFCRIYGDESWAIGKPGEWWLPSCGELIFMYQNLKWKTDTHQNEVFDKLAALPSGAWNAFSGGSHWSSSEYNSNIAVTVGFDSGGLGNNIKNFNHYVRAVSAF